MKSSLVEETTTSQSLAQKNHKPQHKKFYGIIKPQEIRQVNVILAGICKHHTDIWLVIYAWGFNRLAMIWWSKPDFNDITPPLVNHSVIMH